MADVGVRKFELVQGSEADFARVFEYPEEASQSFKAMDPVVLDTSGEVEIGVDTGNVFGVALKDATGTTGSIIPVLLFDPTQIWSASQSNAGAAQVTAQTQVGLACSFIKSTETGETAKTVIDTADTTTPTFEIINLDSRDVLGDTSGRVLFRPITGVATTAR